METASKTVPIERLSFTTDHGVGPRARIGLLVLETDHTIEAECRHLMNIPGVSIYHSRLHCDVTVTPETLLKMRDELPKAAGLLADHLALNVIGYGCTSASTLIGEDQVAKIIDHVHPGIPTTNPMTAAKTAFRALGIERLALLTPYTPDVTKAMQDNFDQAGFSVKVVGSFYEESDAVVGRIDERSILDATLAIGRNDDIDGVFVSCTSLRAAGIINEAERLLDKPVTASNHALAWHLLRLAGIDDHVEGHGRLYQCSL